jgi:acetyl-CoA carboxylase carboxyl transferase subunit alpha
MLGNKLIDGIIKEPIGGAHTNQQATFITVKEEILKHLAVLEKLDPKKRVAQRIDKFCAMGVVNE